MANTDSERVVAAMAGGETKAASSALADLDFHDILGRIIMVIAGLFMAMGFGLMGCGIAILLRAEDLESKVELLGDLPLVTICYVILFIGVIVVVTCAMGLYGGYVQNRFLLTVFLFFLFSILLIQLCMGVFLNQYNSGDILDEVVEDKWFEESEEAVDKRVNYQDYFDCCGWHTPYDSRASGYNTPCPRTDPDACKDATLDWLAQYYEPISIFAIIFALFQLCAVVATVLMLMKSKEDDDDDWLPW